MIKQKSLTLNLISFDEAKKIFNKDPRFIGKTNKTIRDYALKGLTVKRIKKIYLKRCVINDYEIYTTTEWVNAFIKKYHSYDKTTNSQPLFKEKEIT